MTQISHTNHIRLPKPQFKVTFWCWNPTHATEDTAIDKDFWATDDTEALLIARNLVDIPWRMRIWFWSIEPRCYVEEQGFSGQYPSELASSLINSRN